jgi:hypothetical protein
MLLARGEASPSMTGSIASSSRLRPSFTRPALINARLQIVVAKGNQIDLATV